MFVAHHFWFRITAFELQNVVVNFIVVRVPVLHDLTKRSRLVELRSYDFIDGSTDPSASEGKVADINTRVLLSTSNSQRDI